MQAVCGFLETRGGEEGGEGMSIYTASRTRHAHRWIEARANGIRINSTWIDADDASLSVAVAPSGDSWDAHWTHPMVDLWRRCVEEARDADALILYREDGEELKGALVEAGAALGAGKPVFAVGFNGPNDMKAFSFLYHPMVLQCEDLETAFELATALEKRPK
jgi:hypothetical protein